LLLHDYAYVDLPIDAVRRRLTSDPSSWLTSLAISAGADEEALRLRVGPAGDAPLLSRTVRVTCGAPIQRGEVLILPLTWNSERMSSAFPVLEADLEVAPLGDDRTQVTLMGRYEPPLGAFGRGLDRLLFHRIAQATVRSFLGRLSRSLDGGAASQP
jgi:hypothetical protein